MNKDGIFHPRRPEVPLRRGDEEYGDGKNTGDDPCDAIRPHSPSEEDVFFDMLDQLEDDTSCRVSAICPLPHAVPDEIPPSSSCKGPRPTTHDIYFGFHDEEALFFAAANFVVLERGRTKHWRRSGALSSIVIISQLRRYFAILLLLTGFLPQSLHRSSFDQPKQYENKSFRSQRHHRVRMSSGGIAERRPLKIGLLMDVL